MLGVPSHYRWYQAQGWETGNISEVRAAPMWSQASPWAGRGRMDTHRGEAQGRWAGEGCGVAAPRLEEARRAFSPEGPEQVVLGPKGSWSGRRWGPRQEGERRHGGRTKPCGASEGPALARGELEGLRGRAIKAALGPRKTCLRIPGVPADCWRWHPVPQHLCCAPGPRRAPLPAPPAQRQAGRHPARCGTSCVRIVFPDLCSTQDMCRGAERVTLHPTTTP